jgi:hypothetical protein
MVIVDKNDSQKSEYLALEYPANCRVVLTDGVKMGEKIREVWEQIVDLDFVIILNDDHIPRTKHWDQAVISQLNGTNVVFTNDGPAPDKPWVFPNRICGAIAFSGKVLRALGYMFPPGINHLYTDDAWGYLFQRAQCAQGLPDVCVEHAHGYKDPANQDNVFHLVNGEKGLDPQTGQGTGGLWPDDRKAFEEWLKTSAERDALKVLSIQPKTGLMIATPSHDGNCSIPYALGLSTLASFMSTHGIYFETARVTGSSLIPHARNSLVQMFLESRCQKLLFVDADQGWDANHALALFQSPRRLIAGITPHKRYPINLNFDPLEEDRHFFKDLNNKGPEEFSLFAQKKANQLGEIEVARAGTGFMMIDRSVFEIMGEYMDKHKVTYDSFIKDFQAESPNTWERYSEWLKENLPYASDYLAFDGNEQVRHREFFKMGNDISSNRFKGEDWAFVELAKRLHIPIFINVRAIVSHYGHHTFAIA